MILLKEDRSYVNYIRWWLTIRFMWLAVISAPDGDGRALLHTKHKEWVAECKRQWNMRYGAQ